MLWHENIEREKTNCLAELTFESAPTEQDEIHSTPLPACDSHVLVPSHTLDCPGSFDPISHFYFPSVSHSYFLVFKFSDLFNFSLQGIMELLENLRRGAKDGSQNAEDTGKDARDSFPFDNG